MLNTQIDRYDRLGAHVKSQCEFGTREIYEWAAEEGRLPSAYAKSGAFDYGVAPMVKDVFHALRDPSVRDVVNMTGVQCLKTLIGELWLLWCIVENPGPTQWLQPTDGEAKEHAQERFLPLVEGFPVVHRFYTDNRHDKTTTFLRFQHMTLRMEGCGQGNLQRKSIKNQMRSEVWQADKWKRGRLNEASSRLTQFVHNSKSYTESQPGHVAELEVDDMHAAYLAGDQNVWHFPCLSCGRFQPFHWSHVREDGSRAGMRWETSERTRRESGEWRWSELVQTVRYECIYCGHAHADDPLTRRRMTVDGRHVAMNPDAPATVRSFNWGQLAMPNLSWFETRIGGVKNFLVANEQAKRGHEKPLIEFFQKVVGEPYDPDKHIYTQRLQTVDLMTDDSGAFEFQGVKFTHRFMAVDVQADHFWSLVEAYSDRGDSVALEAAQLWTWEEVEEMRERHDVKHVDVSVDVSHRRTEVITECALHGEEVEHQGRVYWVCWSALQGDDSESFTCKTKGKRVSLPYSWPPVEGDPLQGLGKRHPRAKEFLGGNTRKSCAIIKWSNPTIKDVVIRRRDGRAQAVIDVAVPGEWNKEFTRQLHSQKKVPADGKYASHKWKWVKFRDDHLFDCKCMNTVRAFRMRLIS